MTGRLHLLLWTGGACLGIAAPRVFAQSAPRPSLAVAVSGACPESSAVQRVLSTLLPSGVAARSTGSANVSDLGDAYLVAVGARVKKYADPAHDCAERARIAAAFIAFALALDAEPAPSATISTPPAPPPAPPAAPPPPPVARPRWSRVDARGALEVAPRGGLTAPGAAARFATGSNLFGLHAVCGWVSGTSMGLPGERGSVLIERFPCAVGPTLRLLFDPFELNIDAGVAVGAIETRGKGFATTFDAARLELGARVAVDAALHLGRRVAFAPIVGLEATFYPMVYDLDVGHGDASGSPPRSVAAQTPSVWAGVTAGMCWSME